MNCKVQIKCKKLCKNSFEHFRFMYESSTLQTFSDSCSPNWWVLVMLNFTLELINVTDIFWYFNLMTFCFNFIPNWLHLCFSKLKIFSLKDWKLHFLWNISLGSSQSWWSSIFSLINKILLLNWRLIDNNQIKIKF